MKLILTWSQKGKSMVIGTGVEVEEVRKAFSLNSDKGLENSKQWRGFHTFRLIRLSRASNFGDLLSKN